MTDIRKLANNHGYLFVGNTGDSYCFTLEQLQSLLAEHLILSSSEPVAFGYLDDKGAFTFIDRTGYTKVDLYLANPLNTQLLDSHRRLEEALIAAVLGIEFVSEKMNLDLHFVVALKEALLAIPESVKESK
jgi:hypothetical protein